MIDIDEQLKCIERRGKMDELEKRAVDFLDTRAPTLIGDARLFVDFARAECAKLREENERFRQALAKIAEGKGAFSIDPLEHWALWAISFISATVLSAETR